MGIGSAASRAHLPVLGDLERRGLVEVVGACDPSAERRDAVRAHHEQAAGFADNDAMLEATAPTLLVIATPPSAHLDEIRAAASRGIHVLCEKPLGLSDADVATLRTLAADHPDIVIATVQQYRYATPWSWIRRALAGAVRDGEPFALSVTVERPGTDPLSTGGWRADPEHEGGILGDHAVHYLALLNELAPGCAVVGCRRSGPGGREVAIVDVALGECGRARIDVSYAGDRRRNVVRAHRPEQCLDVTWRDGRIDIDHNGRARTREPVDCLSDRATINSLYAPMYGELLGGIADAGWRAAATARTLDVAQLLADALRAARQWAP